MNPTRITLAIIALLILCLSERALARQSESRAESRAESKEATGSITGRLTINGRGLTNLEVILRPRSSGATAAQSVTTDEDGRYRIADLIPGLYSVAPLNSAYIVRSENRDGSPSKTVTVKGGETLEGVDFTLVRGGVITGKVTSAEGRPVIARRVELASLDEERRRRPLPPLGHLRLETDDRGVYRLYGLPAGRYIVSAGDDQDRYMTRSVSTFYQRTYYPGVSEEDQAAIIEVREGSETANIDIQLGPLIKSFSASGRFVTETGEPVPNMGYGQQNLGRDGKAPVSFMVSTALATNAQGEFRLNDLLPGYYLIHAVLDDYQNFYSDPAIFEITDRDLTDLKVIVRRGGTITGTVALDGNADPSLLRQLMGLPVTAAASDALMQNPVYIDNDGGFVITKLRAGKVQLSVGRLDGTGFTLTRVERQGVEQPEGIEVRSGENITGVRLVFAYGKNIIRGQVKIAGGRLPEGAFLSVSAARLSATGPVPGSATGGRVDEQGQFTIEGLAAGDYELQLRLHLPYISGQPYPSPSIPVTQKVTVNNGAATQITLTLDLPIKDKEEKQ